MRSAFPGGMVLRRQPTGSIPWRVPSWFPSAPMGCFFCCCFWCAQKHTRAHTSTHVRMYSTFIRVLKNQYQTKNKNARLVLHKYRVGWWGVSDLSTLQILVEGAPWCLCMKEWLLFLAWFNEWDKEGLYRRPFLFHASLCRPVWHASCIDAKPSLIPANHNIYRIPQTAPLSAWYNYHKNPLSRKCQEKYHHVRKPV